MRVCLLSWVVSKGICTSLMYSDGCRTSGSFVSFDGAKPAGLRRRGIRTDGCVLCMYGGRRSVCRTSEQSGRSSGRVYCPSSPLKFHVTIRRLSRISIELKTSQVRAMPLCAHTHGSGRGLVDIQALRSEWRERELRQSRVSALKACPEALFTRLTYLHSRGIWTAFSSSLYTLRMTGATAGGRD